MSHPVDVNKMVCRHEPMEPVAEVVHVCKHCGVQIESVSCMTCDGEGNMRTGSKCRLCRGTGIDQWEVAT